MQSLRVFEKMRRPSVCPAATGRCQGTAVVEEMWSSGWMGRCCHVLLVVNMQFIQFNFRKTRQCCSCTIQKLSSVCTCHSDSILLCSSNFSVSSVTSPLFLQRVMSSSCMLWGTPSIATTWPQAQTRSFLLPVSGRPWLWTSTTTGTACTGLISHWTPYRLVSGSFRRQRGQQEIIFGSEFNYSPNTNVNQGCECSVLGGACLLHTAWLKYRPPELHLLLACETTVAARHYSPQSSYWHFPSAPQAVSRWLSPSLLQRLCMNGSTGQEVVVRKDLQNVEALTFDPISKLLYWVDAGAQKIEV